VIRLDFLSIDLSADEIKPVAEFSQSYLGGDGVFGFEINKKPTNANNNTRRF
jgi:hypothetical protein